MAAPLQKKATTSRKLAQLALIASGVAALSCRDNIPPEVDGWAEARAALLSGENCFAGRKEYCISDPGFVDSAIQPRLDELYGGKMPPRKVHVDAIARAGALRYKRMTMRPENLAKVEELVKERYHNPVIVEETETVHVDLGVVPGKLDGHPGTLTLSVTDSPMVEDANWKRDELVRIMTTFAERYPEKNLIRVTVTLPWSRDLGGMSYRLFRKPTRLVMTNYKGEMRTTGWLADDAPLSQLPFRFFDLQKCTLSRDTPAVDKPPSTCPPDVDPAALPGATP